MKKAFIVVAPDTDAGKTWITGHLLKELHERTSSAMVMKPIQTGAGNIDGRRISEDVTECLRISGVEAPCEIYHEIVPYLFDAPCSPHLAAELEGEKAIDITLIKKHFHSLAKRYDYILVETAGGILSPINAQETILDMVLALEMPLIVVSPNRLGAISQTLSTLKILVDSGCSIATVIMNDLVVPKGAFEELLLQENLQAVSSFSTISHCYRIPFTKDSHIISDALTHIVDKILL